MQTNSLAKKNKGEINKKAQNKDMKNETQKNNTSKTNDFKYLINKTVIKNNLKRFWVIALAYFLIVFFAGPFSFLLNKEEGIIEVSAINPDFYNYNMMKEVLEFSVQGYLILFTTIIFAFSLGLILNSYLHKKDEMIFTHSLPMTKLTNYLSSFVSMLLILYIPLVLNSVIIALIKFIYSFNAYSYMDILMFIINLIIVGIFTYALTVFTSTLSGVTTFAGLCTIFFSLLPIILVVSINGITYFFVKGAYYNDMLVEKVITYTPFLKLLSLSSEKFTVFQGIIYIVFAIVLLVAGYFLYKYRRNEKTTETLTYDVTKSCFKYLITSLAALPFALVFASMAKGNEWVTLLGALVGIFAGYFISEMTIEKSVFVWNKYKGFLVSVAILMVLIIVVKFDLTGYTSYIPKEDEIEEVYVGKNFLDGDLKNPEVYTLLSYNYEEGILKYPNNLLSDSFTSSNEVIKLARDLHKKVIDNSISRLEDDFNYDSKDVYKEYNQTLQFAYKLKNGNLIVREFTFNLHDILDEYLLLINNEDYKKAEYSELFNINFDSEFKTIDRLMINNEYTGDYEITDEVIAKEVIDAVMKDYYEHKYDVTEIIDNVNNIGVILYYIDEETYNVNAQNLREKYRWDENKIRNNLSEGLSLPKIDENYKNTISCLEKYGMYDSIIVNPSIVDSMKLYKVKTEDFINNNKIITEDVLIESKGIYQTVSEDEAINVFGYPGIRENSDNVLAQFANYEPINITSKDDMFRLTARQDIANYQKQNAINNNEKISLDENEKYKYYVIIDFKDVHKYMNIREFENLVLSRVNPDCITEEMNEKLDAMNNYN